MKTMTGVLNDLVTEDEQDARSLSAVNNKLCKTSKNSDCCNDLGPYGDDSSSPSDSPSDSPSSDSDSDSSVPSSDDDQIDLELLHGLEAIHITVQRSSGQQDEDQLIPKGPQKTHKVRKQGKSTTVPYTQGSSSVPRTGSAGLQGSCSVPRNGGAGLPAYPHGGAGPPHYQGSGTGDDSRVDMVLSESLNDPGFRDNLLYTLQAEVEQYPTLVTPPLSSSDCSYSADYTNSGYSSGSSVSGGVCHSNAYYAQYTPESLHTASPHGSDVSIEDEPYTTASSSNCANSYQSGDSSNTPYSHYHQTESRTSSTGSASYYEQNELCESAARSAGVANYYRNSTEQQDASGIANYYHNSEQSELSSATNVNSVKPLSNAEKFIDNMCVGVKYFLASHKKHPGEPSEEYTITEDRTNSLLTLARVIQAKLDSLKEAEKLVAGAQAQCREESYVSAVTGSVYEYL
uniref:Uncharacterized protein n=1 Tax=Cacopsylla melanoneura TaxID=428564 RepID=A0A8D8VZ90_9HEMI